MGTLKVNIFTSKTDATLARDYERSLSSKYANCQAISDLVESVISGNQTGDGTLPPSMAVSVEGAATRASGTLIGTSVVATDAISINGVTFTAVASGATGNQFNIGVNDAATMADLARSINASASALVSEQVTAAVTTATATPSTLTVYSKNYGVFGNSVTLASADATIVASGARLAGGAVDASAKTYTF